jgi:hypothetical protein
MIHCRHSALLSKQAKLSRLGLQLNSWTSDRAPRRQPGMALQSRSGAITAGAQ